MTLPRRISGPAQARLSREIVRDDGEVGLVIDGRYEIVSRIARGGMGEVFHARDVRLDRSVALKVLALPGAAWAARLEAEARTMTRLEHPGVVPLYDLGTFPDGRLYYTMKFVAGTTLKDLVGSGTSRSRLISILERVCGIVHDAHRLGFIHRDLKPANIMVDENDRVFVMDWGVARMLEEIRLHRGPGEVAGTVAYMSPEQARGDLEHVDERSDVYSLGAILHEMSRPDAELESICRKALRPRPDDRYPSAEALADDLRRCLRGEPVAARLQSLPVRLRRGLRKHWRLAAGLAATIAVALVLAATVGQARRESSLRRLQELWGQVVLAKQEWYQPHKDPAQTRMKIEAAVAALDRHVAARPREAQGFYVRARGRLYLDDVEGAVRDLEDAVRREPGFAPGWALLGRARLERYWRAHWSDDRSYAARLEARDSALQGAREAFSTAGRGGAHAKWGMGGLEEEEVAEVVVRAISRHANGDPEGARAALDEANRRSPSEEYCNLLGGWSADAAENAAWQTEALRIRPHYAKARFDRGAARWCLRLFAEAEDDYTRALRLHPGFAGGYAGRSALRAKLGRYEDAIEDATAALRLDPRQVQAYVNRAAARGASGDSRGELDDAEAALRLDPQHAQAYINRSAAKARLGDPKGALADASEALKIDPRNPLAYVNRAGLRGLLGDCRGELDDATEALKLDPRQPGAHVNRAAARMKLGDFKGALEDASEAIQLNPSSAGAFANRACAKAQAGDYRGALDDSTRALELDPSLAIVYAQRAQVRESLASRATPEAGKGLLRQADEDLVTALRVGGEGWTYRTAVESRLARLRAR